MENQLAGTKAIAEKISNANYQLIKMWECDFDKQLQTNDEMRRFVEEEENYHDFIKMKPLDARDSFYGGLTYNNVKAYDCRPGEVAHYFDFCSLCPFINKRSLYCVGHPKIYVGQEEYAGLIDSENDITRVTGLIICEILPAQNLYHGILCNMVYYLIKISQLC